MVDTGHVKPPSVKSHRATNQRGSHSTMSCLGNLPRKYAKASTALTPPLMGWHELLLCFTKGALIHDVSRSGHKNGTPLTESRCSSVGSITAFGRLEQGPVSKAPTSSTVRCL